MIFTNKEGSIRTHGSKNRLFEPVLQSTEVRDKKKLITFIDVYTAFFFVTIRTNERQKMC